MDLSGGSERGGAAFGGAAQSWAHHSDLVMYARRVLGDRSDTAEDIVQEAYLRLLGLAASDEAPTSARPWLFRVVRNLAIDERRSVARRADPVAEVAILGAAAADDTATLVENREQLNDAFRDIADLPPRERRAIEMDQAGIGAQTIATELGTTPNAVHQALFRARRRMRSGRAVAWGLIPVAAVPFMLRLADPSLAAAISTLPPGVPVGRALPVAGIVAVAMVGGSVVAPDIDKTPLRTTADSAFIAAPTTGGLVAVHRSDDDDTNSGANSGPSSRSGTSGPGSDSESDNSGPGSRNSGRDDDGDDATDDRSGPSRGRADDGDDDDATSGRNRGSGKSAPSTSVADDDDSPSTNRQRGKTKGESTTTTTAGDGPDAPDAPDSPDD